METKFSREQTCQTVTVEDYAGLTGQTVNQVHYQIKSGKLRSINSGPRGKVVIPKARLMSEIDYRPLRALEFNATVDSELAAGLLGYTVQTLRRFCTNYPESLIIFPLGRSFGVTTESLARLFGYPLSLWPVLPEPKVETPATPEIAIAVAPEVIEVIRSMRRGLDTLEAWISSLMPTEPEAPSVGVTLPLDLGAAVTGSLPTQEKRNLPGDIAWNLGRQSAES